MTRNQWPFVVQGKPHCAECGKRYGQRHRLWPAAQKDPSPWDGTSWRAPYNPFCTLRCALAYARKTYASIARMQIK